ncbi:hypothetical protein T4D_11358 [Trichinella pseudospiralis]|uniref:Uncharacterized protein n=1 Tax=Trichinella pseudospiralis TaxID=6337 RepID=A0A0V1G379_TRIPS|nr:hypothetical protein T4D_11358 [Trichinella pseudospiralis]
MFNRVESSEGNKRELLCINDFKSLSLHNMCKEHSVAILPAGPLLICMAALKVCREAVSPLSFASKATLSEAFSKAGWSEGGAGQKDSHLVVCFVASEG